MSLVAYESDNQITNAGQNAWKKETGLLSIWILGMFNPSPSATIVVPIHAGPEAELGVKVTSDYFGSIPPERLVVKDNVIYFAADGKYRSKIGISPKRSKAVLGSYDADNQVLTIVQFSQPAGVTDYVNSLWKLQDNPYGGDAANSYNDGPPVTRRQAARSVLRTGIVVSGRRAGSGKEPLARSSHHPSGRSGSRPGCRGPHDARRVAGRDQQRAEETVIDAGGESWTRRHVMGHAGSPD